MLGVSFECFVDTNASSGEVPQLCLNVFSHLTTYAPCVEAMVADRESLLLLLQLLHCSGSCRPGALHVLYALASTLELGWAAAKHGGVVYILQLLLPVQEEIPLQQRAAAASLLGKLVGQPMHGPRVAIALARFFPDGLVSAIRDGPGEAVVTALEQTSETPELVWTPAMAASLGAQIATMASDLYREQIKGRVVDWDLPEHASGQEMKDEPQVGGVYVRLFLKDPKFPLRNPKRFLEGLLDQYVSAVAATHYTKEMQPADPELPLLLSAALVSLLRVHPALADHVRYLGYVPKLVAAMAYEGRRETMASEDVKLQINVNLACFRSLKMVKVTEFIGYSPFLNGAIRVNPCEQRLPRSFIKLPSSSSELLISPRSKNLAALSFNSNSDWRGRRQLCGVSDSCQSRMEAAPLHTAQISETFFRNALTSMERTYLSKNLTVSSVLDLVRAYDGGQVCYDHFAFRTFNVDNCGISALAQFFLDFGYIARGELSFPARHLRALWFSPPQHLLDCSGEGLNGPLPRIFISELLVDKLSLDAQAIIKKYTGISSSGSKYAALARVLGSLTWPTPLFSDFQLLARESEYAAWTPVNGYALNHLTISVHRLNSDAQKIGKLNEIIQSNNFRLDTEGGILKVSPDGRLLQSSTVADSMVFHFAEGISESVPASYIEFAERLVQPEYENLPVDKILESHRRDGFEVGKADKIFESTESGSSAPYYALEV